MNGQYGEKWSLWSKLNKKRSKKGQTWSKMVKNSNKMDRNGQKRFKPWGTKGQKLSKTV